MKTFAQVLPLIFFAFIFTNFAQETTTKWIRVQSNNGEFSIEVPTQSNYFYDKEGFSVSADTSDYKVKEMNLLNAYPEKTLVSFETYKADKKVLDILRERDKQKGKSSEFKSENYRVKQIVIKTDKSYTVRQYFNSKDYIYILTVASREGETKIMKRFFDSLVFKPNTTELNPNAIQFAKLKVTIPEIDPNPPPLKIPDKASILEQNPPKDENALPLIILFKPNASFTDASRATGANGIVRLRITFSADGGITKVGLLKTIGEGLTRQAFFAALRLKFLPSEKDGKPQTVSKIVEYSFSFF